MRVSKNMKLPHVRLQQTQGAHTIRPKISTFSKRGQMVPKFPGKSSRKLLKLLNFRKASHSTENSGNFGIKVKWKGNFHEKKNRKFGYTSRGCPLFRNLCKVPTYYSARASSFGRDHSQLDISRKIDGDAHSIKETL